jgi:hypothetical protein
VDENERRDTFAGDVDVEGGAVDRYLDQGRRLLRRFFCRERAAESACNMS